MSKIVQIACSESSDAKGSRSSVVYALSDDGRVFELHEQAPATDLKHHAPAGVWSSFWRPLPSLDVSLPTFIPRHAGYTDRDVHPNVFLQHLAMREQAKAAEVKPVPADVF